MGVLAGWYAEPDDKIEQATRKIEQATVKCEQVANIEDKVNTKVEQIKTNNLTGGVTSSNVTKIENTNTKRKDTAAKIVEAENSNKEKSSLNIVRKIVVKE